MTPAERTGRPSSVNANAPASASSAISVRSSPACPRVTAAVNPVGMRASVRARSRRAPSTGAESTTGSVFGMARIAQYPPAAAAWVPVSRSSSSSRPGVRRCTWGSTKPGKAVRPSPRTSSAPSGASSAPASPTFAMRPPRTRTSPSRSRPTRGSIRRAPRTSTVPGAVSARSSAGWSSPSALTRAGAPWSRPAGCRAGARRVRCPRRRRAARTGPPCAPPRRTRPAPRSAPAASRSPRPPARRRG